ncbi:MAG: metallophosphoesterase [Phycisphaerales bacterium]
MSRDELSDAGVFIERLDAAVGVLRDDAKRRGATVHLPRSGRLTITGDLHDNPLNLERILRYADVGGGTDRHVILQEMIHGDRLVNGVDLSHRMLGRVAALILEHPGRIHPLLANHELAQMRGDSVSKGGGDNVALFDEGLDWVFGDDAEPVAEAIGRFVAAMPLALRTESGILCSHSLPAASSMKWFDPGILDRDLVEEDYAPPRGGAYAMVWGRGHTPPQVRDLATAWGVELLCVGHGFAETGAEAVCPGLLMLNSDHERAAAWRVELAAPPPSSDVAAIEAMPLAAVDAMADLGRDSP